MTDEMLTAQLQRALTAAADQIQIRTPINGLTPAAAGPTPSTRKRRPVTVRWLLPAVAAAAVAVLLAAGVFFWQQQQNESTATQVNISGDVADVGGVRFPVPDGWQVAVTKSGDDAVHVCVAADPAQDCDGVQLDIAVPGWFGKTPLLNSGNLDFFGSCPGGAGVNHTIMTDDHNPIDVAGRPGVHEWGYCSDNPTAVSHFWQLDDLSLQVYSPPGRYATEIASIVAGLDLTQWAHPQGPQAAFFTSASSAPPTS